MTYTPKPPVHPEPHTYTWTNDEMKVIREAQIAAYAAGQRDMREAAAKVVEEFPHWLGRVGRIEIAADINALPIGEIND